MDRKAYLKSYYERNKERLKEKKIMQPEIYPTPPLFQQLNVENSASFKLNLTHLNIIVLALFLLCNTFFLTYEQVSFYRLKSYNIYESIFFSILTESAILLLSFFSSFMQELKWKIVLRTLLLFSVIAVAFVINAGVEKKASVEQKNSTTIQLLTDELNTLKQLEQKTIENIEAWDAKTHRSKREALLREFDQGIRKKIDEKGRELSQLNLSENIQHETDIMQWLRFIALAWNVVLGQLLAYFWQRAV